MENILSSLLEASFRGSIVILAIIALRLLLKRAPKSLFCLLWLLAGLRLMLPFEIESIFSLQPRLENTPIVIRQELPALDDVPGTPVQFETDSAPEQTATLPEGNWGEMEQTSYLYIEEEGQLRPATFADIAVPLWLLGLGSMLLLSLASYRKLKRRVSEACRTADGCWECSGLETAFVLGIVNPRIYLPTGLSGQERKFILDHENTHIARKDHISKLLGYLVLSVHWFNPLVWLGYHLLCRDIELACDERVVKHMDLQQRKAYSGALLTCGSHTARFSACPVAFGESSPRQRILNVLNYRKPTVWIMGLALIAVIFVSVCLLTSPAEKVPEETPPEVTIPATEPATQPQEETDPSAPQESDPGVSDGFENYTLRYTDPRDRAWEEDIVYMANTYLTTFPKVADISYFEYRMYEQNPGGYLVGSNRLYDEAVRNAFIQATRDLLDRIPQLNDTELGFELLRLKSVLQTAMTGSYSGEYYFTLGLEPLEQDGRIDFYAAVVCEDQRYVLGSRLTAVNGIPLETVMNMLQPYAYNESSGWTQCLLMQSFFSSFIVNQELLRHLGILDPDSDTAEYTFVTQAGEEITAVFTAVSTEEKRPSLAWEDGYRTWSDFTGSWTNDKPLYWYEVLPDCNSLYLRVRTCREESGYSFQTLLREVSDLLNGADTPMNLIVDIRTNTGGSFPMSGYDDFVRQMAGIPHNKVYFLANETTGISTWMINLMELHTEVTVVGAPTACLENNWGGAKAYKAPNNGFTFYVPTQYWMFRDTQTSDVRIPDITVHQSLQDHIQGIDTVLTYVMDLARQE